MVVWTQRKAVLLHDGKVVLPVVGAGVFSPAPLGEVPVVAGAHDGGPSRLSDTMPLVVGLPRGAIMAESQRVTCLVAGGLRQVLGRGPIQPFREDKGRLETGMGRTRGTEDTHPGHPSVVPKVERKGTDQHPGAELGIRGIGPMDLVLAQELRRHIDVEGSIVLGHTRPDLLNATTLLVVEGFRDPVDVKRRRQEVLTAEIVGVPDSSSDEVAIEIKVKDAGGSGPAVESERVLQ